MRKYIEYGANSFKSVLLISKSAADWQLIDQLAAGYLFHEAGWKDNEED